MSTTRGERRVWLAKSREAIYKLPLNELFELPGRPHVVYQIRSYEQSGKDTLAEAASLARSDMPFLFKAFETGQIGPKRMAKMHGGKPRVATIHEYLDWTVTAQSSPEDEELDFGGFRVVVLLPRYVSHWPYPGDPGNCEGKGAHPELGARLPPYPLLQTHGRPMCAATIRSGPGYLEVPFVATQEHKRGKGYCRCMVEAIEDIARALHLPKLLLCSTNDPIVKSTWHHLNFDFASDEQMEEWDVPHADLVYLQNTTQMHKEVPPPGQYRPITIKHKDFQQRTYARLDEVVKRPRLHERPAPLKALPPKKPHTHRGSSACNGLHNNNANTLANSTAYHHQHNHNHPSGPNGLPSSSQQQPHAQQQQPQQQHGGVGGNNNLTYEQRLSTRAGAPGKQQTAAEHSEGGGTAVGARAVTWPAGTANTGQQSGQTVPMERRDSQGGEASSRSRSRSQSSQYQPATSWLVSRHDESHGGDGGCSESGGWGTSQMAPSKGPANHTVLEPPTTSQQQQQQQQGQQHSEGGKAEDSMGEQGQQGDGAWHDTVDHMDVDGPQGAYNGGVKHEHNSSSHAHDPHFHAAAEGHQGQSAHNGQNGDSIGEGHRRVSNGGVMGAKHEEQPGFSHQAS